MKILLTLLLTIIFLGCKNNPQGPNDNNDLQSKIAFAKSDSLGTTIFTINPDGSELDTLYKISARHRLNSNLQWSADGSKLSFLINDSLAIISIINPETIVFNYISQDAQGFSWFPDSRHIAVSATGIIYKLDTYTNLREKITEGTRPEVSPNGEFISYRYNEAIYVMDLKNGSTQYITDSPAGMVQWSPTSDRIAFVSGNELWSITKNGDDKTLLFTGDVHTTYKWSPDGEKIAYGKAYGFGVVRTDGSKDEIISLNNSYSPSWSPENNSIVYLLLGLDEQSIYIYNLMNKSKKLLRSLNSGALAVAWSP